MLAAHELSHMAGANGRMEGELMCEMIGLRAVQAYRASRDLPPAHVEHITFDRSQWAQVKHDWIAKHPPGKATAGFSVTAANSAAQMGHRNEQRCRRRAGPARRPGRRR
jgi:hypothetical protein